MKKALVGSLRKTLFLICLVKVVDRIDPLTTVQLVPDVRDLSHFAHWIMQLVIRIFCCHLSPNTEYIINIPDDSVPIPILPHQAVHLGLQVINLSLRVSILVLDFHKVQPKEHSIHGGLVLKKEAFC